MELKVISQKNSGFIRIDSSLYYKKNWNLGSVLFSEGFN